MGKSEPTLVAIVFEGVLLVAGKPFKSTMHSFVCYTKLDILKYLPQALYGQKHLLRNFMPQEVHIKAYSTCYCAQSMPEIKAFIL